MAISKTGAIYKTLTFDGENSKDYGIYITGEAVFNAPEREVEMVTIPGRNGQFALDMGRFENIEVTYPAGLFASTESDFADAISDFRNLLCSKRGYVRLQDDYNPNEYRMAVYKSGLELDPLQLKAGEFEITFDCKPQRYLTSGEQEVTVGGSGTTETVSGESVEIDNPDGNVEIQSLSVLIEPLQSGTGIPSPDNLRPISGYDSIGVIVSPTQSALDGHTYTITLPETVYGGTLNVVTGELVINMAIVDMGTLSWTYSAYPITGEGSVNLFITNLVNNKLGSVNYICEAYQITGDNRNTLSHKDKAFAPINNTSTYMAFRDSSYTDASAFTSAMNGIQLCYELATPQTYQLTPQSIDLLLGTNNIWSDGDVTVDYAENHSMLYNPTLFDAKPLLQLNGYGKIAINGNQMSVNSGPLGNINVSSFVQTNVASITVPIQTQYANPGDPITVNVNLIAAFYPDQRVKSAWTDGGTGVDFYMAMDMLRDQTIIAQLPNFGYVYGTSKTGTASITVNCTMEDNSSATAGMAVSHSYNGSDTFTFSITSITNPAGWGEPTSSIEVQPIILNSSQSRLGNPLYLDLDLGEAYKIENDIPVSINNGVSLPMELPTLPPGVSTITFDNTYTQVKIVPRWWKV